MSQWVESGHKSPLANDFLRPDHLCLKLPDAANQYPLQTRPAQDGHDGWTAVRQQRFIDELVATKSISPACVRHSG